MLSPTRRTRDRRGGVGVEAPAVAGPDADGERRSEAASTAGDAGAGPASLGDARLRAGASASGVDGPRVDEIVSADPALGVPGRPADREVPDAAVCGAWVRFVE